MKFPDTNKGRRALDEDVAAHPNLMELTRQGFVHTETYGQRDEIWYLTHDDGRYQFYNVEKDEITSSKPLNIPYMGKDAPKHKKIDSRAVSGDSERNGGQI